MQDTQGDAAAVSSRRGRTRNDVEALRAADAPPAELIDGSIEDAYWRENFQSRPYADETVGYDQYRPAFRYGWESRMEHPGRRWDQVERKLQGGWRERRGVSRLGWPDAKQAAKDAWQRVERRLADAREEANPTLPEPAPSET